jgi:hypothetical protein
VRQSTSVPKVSNNNARTSLIALSPLLATWCQP